MARFLAGAAACFLLLTGAFLFWQGQAASSAALPDPPRPRTAAPMMLAGAVSPTLLNAPEASPQNREAKRFSRADKNKDGRVESDEVLTPRRKAFAKLDVNGNGSLSFEEWASKTIGKFNGADRDRSGWLSAAEYASTAPPPPKHKSCSCATAAAASDN